MDARQNTPNEPKGIVATLKDRSLESAGLGYLAADAALGTAAMLRKDKQVGALIASMCWGVGSIAALRYGHKPLEKHLHELSLALKDDLEQQGIDIPDESALSAQNLSQKGGVIDGIEDFIYRHPSQVFNGIYGAGGTVQALTAAEKSYRNSGLLVATGGLLGIFLSEKEMPKDMSKDAPAEASSSLNPITWFTDKPLRVSSAFYMANNYYLVKSAMGEAEQAPKLLKFGAVGAYIFANVMLALSSKIHGKQSDVPDDVLNSVEQEAANVVATLPKEAQRGIMQHIAEHLSEHDGVNQSPDEIRTAMTARLQEITTPHTRIAQATHQQTVIETSPASLNV